MRRFRALLVAGILCVTGLAYGADPLSKPVPRVSLPGSYVIQNGSSLQGVTATGSAINATVGVSEYDATTGAEYADGYKSVQPGYLPSSAGSLYAPAAGRGADLISIQLANTTGSQVCGNKIFIGGTAATNQITGSFCIAANGTATWTGGEAWTFIDGSGQHMVAMPGYVSASRLLTTTAPLKIAGGTSADLAADRAFTCDVASGSQPGCLASADFTTFSGKQAGPLTGDVTTSGAAATLATVNSNVGTFQGITVNGKGLVTAAANQSYLTGNQTVTLSGDVSGAGATAITTTLATVNSNVGTFGDSANVAAVTANGKGLITAIANVAIRAASAVQSGFMSALHFNKVQNAYYDLATDFGWVGDQVRVEDAACSTGANTKITSATINFQQNFNYYLNKRITLAGAGSGGAMLVGTISNIDSATQVTIAGTTCQTTVSSKAVQMGTDNTAAAAAMVSTINALTYPGVTIHIPMSYSNRWATSSTMTFTRPVSWEGQGGAVNEDFGDYTRAGGSALAWWGTSNDGGTPFQGFMKYVPVSGASAQPIAGISLRNLWIDGRNGDQNNALWCLQLYDVVGFSIDNVFCIDSLNGYEMNVLEPIGGTASTSRGKIGNIGVRVLENAIGGVDGAAATLTPTTVAAGSNNLVLTTSGQSVVIAAANGIDTPGYVLMETNDGTPALVYCTGGGGTTTLTGCRVDTNQAADSPTLKTGCNVVQNVPNNGACFETQGSLTANTNLFAGDLLRMSYGANWGSACINYRNADTIQWKQVVGNGGDNTNDGIINRRRHPGVRFHGSNTNVALAARNNVFLDIDPGIGGTESMSLQSDGATKLTGPAGPNYMRLYQLANAAPAPNIGAGSYLDWEPNGGFMEAGLRSYDQTAAVAYTASTAKTIPGTSFIMAQQAIQVGTTFKWQFQLGKSAAGAAARLTNVRIGTTGTQTDANVCQFSTATTAIADTALVEVTYAITALSGASTTGICSMTMVRAVGSTATGLFSTIGNLVQVGTPTAFTAPSGVLWYISLSLTTGASEVATSSLGKGYVERVATQAN